MSLQKLTEKMKRETYGVKEVLRLIECVEVMRIELESLAEETPHLELFMAGLDDIALGMGMGKPRIAHVQTNIFFKPEWRTVDAKGYYEYIFVVEKSAFDLAINAAKEVIKRADKSGMDVSDWDEIHEMKLVLKDLGVES